MRKLTLGLGALALVMFVVLLGSKPTGPRTAEDYAAQYGGLTGAYRSVLQETDCAELRALFQTASDNKTTGFMVAIDDRMTALGC